jgi:O-antigen ligase
MLFHYAQDHLWTGAGFGSFWNVGDESPVYKYGQGFSTLVAVGHNGYLDLLVTVGLPGLMLAVIAVFIWPMMRMLTTHSLRPAKGGLICALLVFCIGHNFTESSLLDRDALTGMVAILVVGFILYATQGRGSSSRSRKRSRKQSEAGDELLQTMKTRRSRNRA